jgi:hypothetical protein
MRRRGPESEVVGEFYFHRLVTAICESGQLFL